MGLLAEMDVHKWNFVDSTPTLHIPIDYSGVGELFGSTAQELAQGSCPVRTGYLQSSISGSGSGPTGSIQASAEYAQYVEFGTWKMAAQEYFTPAVQQAAAAAFEMAAQIYQQAMTQEAMELMMQMMAEQMADQMSGMMEMASFSDRMAMGDNTLTAGGQSLIETVGGVSFNREGKVIAGLNWMMTQPGMWRENTSFYSVAQTRQANLESYRATAMERFRQPSAPVSSYMSALATGNTGAFSGGSSAAVNFGTGVGMGVMSGIMSSGGSFLGGMLGGMAVGGLATLIGLVLGDIFGSNEPEFSVPDIIIT